ncbi:MAG: LLM class flavin-dependent oxidoreductase [Acidobacteriota bacterium]
MRLSVLDQSPIPEGATAGDALHNSIDLAQLAERLGYHRYWVAEHHGTPGLACNSPEVLIGPIAAATHTIRVGSGGVMLPHYSPLKVAENFSMLASLYPHRIDLGLGRAAGTSAAVAHALRRDRRMPAQDDFPAQLEELFGYFENRPTGPIRVVTFESPDLYLLGSSGQSAVWAAEMGLPYVFADFINPTGAPLAAFYRDNFVASARCPKPYVAVCAWAMCADTDEEAMRLSYSLRMLSINLARGRQFPVPTVEDAEEFLLQEGPPPSTIPEGRRILTGSPATMKAKLTALAEEYRADEVFLVSIVHSHAARRRSHELLAQAFELK